MKMRALDSFCAAEIGMQHAGAEFEISDARGKEFAARGLAVEVEDVETTDGAEAEEQTVEHQSGRPAKRAKATKA